MRVATILSTLAIVIIVNFILQVLRIGCAKFLVGASSIVFLLPSLEGISRLNPHLVGTPWYQVHLTGDSWQPKGVDDIFRAQFESYHFACWDDHFIGSGDAELRVVKCPPPLVTIDADCKHVVFFRCSEAITLIPFAKLAFF